MKINRAVLSSPYSRLKLVSFQRNNASIAWPIYLTRVYIRNYFGVILIKLYAGEIIVNSLKYGRQDIEAAPLSRRGMFIVLALTEYQLH